MNKFVILIIGRNTEKWVQQCLQSAINQDYPKELFHVIWIDDASTDNSIVLAYRNTKTETDWRHSVIVIDRKYPIGGLANIYRAIHEYIRDDEIVVVLGGDDWFLQGSTRITRQYSGGNYTQLKRINQEYLNGGKGESPNMNEPWLTYGQFICSNGEPGWASEFPSGILEAGILPATFRKDTAWRFSNPMTFRAKLFKKIPKEDLMLGNGFYPMAGDVAMVLPMLEMAGRARIRFIPDILYVYNLHEDNDHAKDIRLQKFCAWHVKQRRSFMPLVSLDDEPQYFPNEKRVEGNALMLLPRIEGVSESKSAYEIIT